MSQKKVDEYKKFKANRKEIFAKEKRQKKLQKIMAVIVAVLVVGGFGYWGVYSIGAEKVESTEFISLITQDQYGFILPTTAE